MQPDFRNLLKHIAGISIVITLFYYRECKLGRILSSSKKSAVDNICLIEVGAEPIHSIVICPMQAEPLRSDKYNSELFQHY